MSHFAGTTAASYVQRRAGKKGKTNWEVNSVWYDCLFSQSNDMCDYWKFCFSVDKYV